MLKIANEIGDFLHLIDTGTRDCAIKLLDKSKFECEDGRGGVRGGLRGGWRKCGSIVSNMLTNCKHLAFFEKTFKKLKNFEKKTGISI